MIKNIIFDFGGVLLDLDAQKSFSALGNLMGKSEEEAGNIYKENKELFDDFEKGEIIMENFLWNIQNLCKDVPDAPELLAAWNAMLLGWNPNKLALLDGLKEKYKVYLLSNTNEIHINWVLRDLKKNHNITDFETRFFDKIYFSHELKMRKPDLEIYEFVTNDALLNKEETLFIDDNADNIAAAKEHGWHGHLHVTNAEIDLDEIMASKLG